MPGDPCAPNVDLCDFDAITHALTQIRPSAIVHLAGIASPTHSKIGEMYATNVVGTANLFAALGIAKIEPTSSSSPAVRRFMRFLTPISRSLKTARSRQRHITR